MMGSHTVYIVCLLHALCREGYSNVVKWNSHLVTDRILVDKHQGHCDLIWEDAICQEHLFLQIVSILMDELVVVAQ